MVWAVGGDLVEAVYTSEALALTHVHEMGGYVHGLELRSALAHYVTDPDMIKQRASDARARKLAREGAWSSGRSHVEPSGRRLCGDGHEGRMTRVIAPEDEAAANARLWRCTKRWPGLTDDAPITVCNGQFTAGPWMYNHVDDVRTLTCERCGGHAQQSLRRA